MMTNQFELNSRVVAPFTDADGEPSFVIGTLIGINQRLAKVQLDDGTVINVGKTKIEAFIPPAEEKKSKNTICPKCGQEDSVWDYKHVEGTNSSLEAPYISMTKRLWCQACDECWGPAIKKGTGQIVRVKSSSGRSSVDNGDIVAELLRGKSLEQCYQIAATTLNTVIQELMARYCDLNPGQQRMCLGNRLRGHYKKAEQNKSKES